MDNFHQFNPPAPDAKKNFITNHVHSPLLIKNEHVRILVSCDIYLKKLKRGWLFVNQDPKSLSAYYLVASHKVIEKDFKEYLAKWHKYYISSHEMEEKAPPGIMETVGGIAGAVVVTNFTIGIESITGPLCGSLLRVAVYSVKLAFGNYKQTKKNNKTVRDLNTQMDKRFENQKEEKIILRWQILL